MTRPKRQINEWLTIMRIAPEVKTAFFEGPSDARLIERVIGKRENLDFRSGDEIEYDTSDGTTLCGGNKLRLVRLAQAAILCKPIENLRCLVDKDFDDLKKNFTLNTILLSTDFSNIIVGSIDIDWIKSFFYRAYAVSLSEKELSSLISSLKFSFFLRFHCVNVETELSFPDIDRYLQIKSGFIYLDTTKIVRKLFGNSVNAPDLIQEVNDFLNQFDGDFRNFINSNDFYRLVFGILKRKNAIGGSVSPDSIRQTIIAALPLDLGNQSKLETLREWADH